MTRRERLNATLKGKPVDRPAVNFYEIGGVAIDGDDPNPFNVYNDPSWKPLLDLAETRTDLIRMRQPDLSPAYPEVGAELVRTEEYEEGGSLFTRTTIFAPGRTLTTLLRRDREVYTLWTVEHLLKGVDDLEAYLQLPDEFFRMRAECSALAAEEEALGDRGVVMVDTGDPICAAASLFDMAEYTVIAMTEQKLFRSLLEKISPAMYEVARTVAERFPGRLWRICGPEYASEPYLPPSLFREYVAGYTTPIIDAIHSTGGFARLHCHGRLKSILPIIIEMGADGLDPIEPPHQGDMVLSDVRREYGKDLVLFGNLEVSDIETMDTKDFRGVVRGALEQGTQGDGRGFVLMPSSAPYGRHISGRVLANYEHIVEAAVNWS